MSGLIQSFQVFAARPCMWSPSLPSTLGKCCHCVINPVLFPSGHPNIIVSLSSHRSTRIEIQRLAVICNSRTPTPSSRAVSPYNSVGCSFLPLDVIIPVFPRNLRWFLYSLKPCDSFLSIIGCFTFSICSASLQRQAPGEHRALFRSAFNIAPAAALRPNGATHGQARPHLCAYTGSGAADIEELHQGL